MSKEQSATHSEENWQRMVRLLRDERCVGRADLMADAAKMIERLVGYLATTPDDGYVPPRGAFTKHPRCKDICQNPSGGDIACSKFCDMLPGGCAPSETRQIGFNEFLGRVQGKLIEDGYDPPRWPDTIRDQGDLESALDSCVKWCKDHLSANSATRPSRERLLAKACDAAFAFIDSHAADPDLTEEMVRKYATYQEARAELEGTK